MYTQPQLIKDVEKTLMSHSINEQLIKYIKSSLEVAHSLGVLQGIGEVKNIFIK